MPTLPYLAPCTFADPIIERECDDWGTDDVTPCPTPATYVGLFVGCEHFTENDDWIGCCEKHARTARQDGHPDNECIWCHAPLRLVRLTAAGIA